MQEYVAGFAFDPSRSRVLLIEKNRPDWQAGKLNGVGGHIGEKELPIAAMRREFLEETGLQAETPWQLFAILGDARDWRVHFFWCTARIGEATQKTDERLLYVRVEDLQYRLSEVIPNLTWLIPMALTMPWEHVAYFVIEEKPFVTKVEINLLYDPALPPVVEFQGEYRFLSNFWPATVIVGPHVYPSAEHAYQASKAITEPERLWVASAPNPAQAKVRGRKIKLRPGWENTKLLRMSRILKAKFSDSHLGGRLLKTSYRELIEGNLWEDRFWGVCHGVGKNHLGNLLMEIRKDIREGKIQLENQIEQLHSQ